MRYRPIVGLLFYIVSVAGVATLATELGLATVRHAAADLAFDNPSVPKSSRVDRGLEAQARTAAWQPSHYVVETRALNAPDISVAALARSIDAAESSSSAPAAPKSPVAPKSEVSKARVAGWVKRADRPARDNTLADADCPARIIERSLKAEI